jgi:hypothetical protein
MLGKRYGWIPDASDYPNGPEFDWLNEHEGASITEFEMISGALSKLEEMQEKAFFFFRDSSFERYLCLHFASVFGMFKISLW